MQLCDDNYIEIMLHLDWDLHHFAQCNKKLNQLYHNHRHLLCDEEHYRFTPQQRTVFQLSTHPSILPTVFSTPHPGMKSVILSAAFKQPKRAMIMTTKTDLDDWRLEADKLYRNNTHKRNQITICGAHRDVQTLHATSKILILSIKLSPYYNNEDKWIVVYKMTHVKDSYHFAHVVFLTPIQQQRYQELHHCNVITLPHTTIKHHIEHAQCYNPKLAYLPAPVVHLNSLDDRLRDVMHQILLCEGPYLIIDDFIDQYTVDLFCCKNIHSDFNASDIVCTYAKQLLKNPDVLRKCNTVVYLWPAHDIYYPDVCNLFNQLTHTLRILMIHSTEEEIFWLKTHCRYDPNQYLDIKQTQGTRGRIGFLTHVKKLIEQYGDALNNIKEDYFRLLWLGVKGEHGKIEKMIEQDIIQNKRWIY